MFLMLHKIKIKNSIAYSTNSFTFALLFDTTSWCRHCLIKEPVSRVATVSNVWPLLILSMNKFVDQENERI